jgi:hypothetical protein
VNVATQLDGLRGVPPLVQAVRIFAHRPPRVTGVKRHVIVLDESARPGRARLQICERHDAASIQET